MNVHFIIHEYFESEGYFGTWVKNNRYIAQYSKRYLGVALPRNSDEFDLLVVLGGPQSPATTTQECPYFDAQKERSLILHTIESGKSVVGVCLGAQLIGEALDAKHQTSPEPEIGSFPIQLTPEGIKDPLLTGFSLEEQVGHWHGDMPGLTADAKVLAASQGCPRQIVRYGDLVYGFQCHLEFVPEQFDALIENSQQDLTTLKDKPFVQSPSEIKAMPTRHMNALLGQFLDGLVAIYQAKKAQRG
ncbi:putative glutamine amidotransferase [Vibrio nigripulchritudo SO65]|uniref:glutamine amidotransferase-related protein n=1 Tax=Vibrio nigripulchritudo TaxID=28173 RepID=UPI0003B20644|nr:glutamine amidotransferase [Vibrio nigripulchritudo]CCN33113.1 putative glutamine amidotransferase [Vibrio nigripulchritudo AM115]CCN41198.1 putative glutamine amidotransferase [Vibrio nigripulchritudo FTn2]CCN67970.1 putative glutamine amidotransferase [Vibrio nigripulchritudo POn4]CCN78256.1 putative glutamine amidotransferase [Vibrio nigripulchritudo SO65]